MAQPSKIVLALIASMAIALAGCTGDGASGDDTPGQDAPPIDATSTTGGIRGVVVDDRITPIAGAAISIVPGDEALVSDAQGLFAVSGLEPGTYIIKVSHPLYASAQQSTDVVAGETEPDLVKVQLLRTVFAEPYFNTLQYDGFIVCSANAVAPDPVGGVLSEECGEGLGVPGVGRVGGQSNNNVQFDFYSDGPFIKSMVVEQVWEATSETARGLYTPISLDWVCDPFCGGKAITKEPMQGESPLRAFIDESVLGKLNLTSDTRISTFTWASPATTPIGVTLNQKFTVYVTNFYHLGAPEDWSFVAGSPDPF